MNQATRQLLPGIVTYVEDHGGYVTKTKLLKLLYLFDVEYYRQHRTTFTGFDWKFFHLGPWTAQYEGLLDELVATGFMLEGPSARSEYETKFYHSAERFDFSSLFTKFSDEAILRTVLNTWGQSSTGEILDFVYFRTEPMERGIRNERLDFTHIQELLPPKYVRSSSGATTRDIRKLRERLAKKLESRSKTTQFKFTPPKYDEQFVSEMERLERQS